MLWYIASIKAIELLSERDQEESTRVKHYFTFCKCPNTCHSKFMVAIHKIIAYCKYIRFLCKNSLVNEFKVRS